MSAFAAFEEAWLDRLRSRAEVAYQYQPRSEPGGLHSAVADQFTQSLGLTPIGFNWELLDANASASEPRSALGELVNALAHDIGNPSEKWLGEAMAQACAHDFLNLFDQTALSVVANRYDGLWNPISGAAVEWGFVGFDDANIALLLMAQE